MPFMDESDVQSCSSSSSSSSSPHLPLEVPTAVPLASSLRTTPHDTSAMSSSSLRLLQRLRNNYSVNRKALFSFAFLVTMIVGTQYYWNHYYHDSTTTTSSSMFLTAEDYAAHLLAIQQGDVTADNPAVSSCLTALDCGAGQWCAFPSMHNMSIRVCCAEAVNLGLPGAENAADAAWLTVCTGAAVGEPCGSHHDLCASGYCIHGKCAAQGLDVGATCPDDHGHCASGACGRYHYNTTRSIPQQCCPTADVWETTVEDIPYPLHFCHGTAQEGQPCGGQDALCQDGLMCNDQGVCKK